MAPSTESCSETASRSTGPAAINGAAERLDRFAHLAVMMGFVLAALTFFFSAWFLVGVRDGMVLSPDDWSTILKNYRPTQDELELLLTDRAFQLVVLVRIAKSLGGLVLTFCGMSLLVLGIRQPVDAELVGGQGWQAKGVGLSPGLLALLAGAYLMNSAPDGLRWEHQSTAVENESSDRMGATGSNDGITIGKLGLESLPAAPVEVTQTRPSVDAGVPGREGEQK
jgi:hypothetical protein